MNLPMNKALDHTLVIDIGKSRARVLVIDGDGGVAGQAACTNTSVAGPGYAALGIDLLQQWLLDQVPKLAGRERVGRAVVSTHGAAFCAVDDEGLVLPAIDYEWNGYGSHRAEFEEAIDPASHTGSLPLGLIAGLHLHWVKAARPADWARVRHWLPYPQFWAWWLSGVAASEVSSLGCHTQLWSPATGQFSRWAVQAGVAERFAPLRSAWDVLGRVTPAMARRLDLPAACEVVCGVHDSNACLARYLDLPGATLLTTGTWTVAMAPGASPARLAPERDMLLNVAVDGRAVPTARFMGGREFEAICAGAPAAAATAEALACVIAGGWVALPSFAEAGGPYQGRTGKLMRNGVVVPIVEVPAALRPALASWYCALVAHECIAALGSNGPVVVEGPLAGNAAFTTALSALLGNTQPLQRSTDPLEGTARGAARLARWDQRFSQPVALETLAPPGGTLAEAIRHHASEWRRLASS
jgi:L-fuculokinase